MTVCANLIFLGCALLLVFKYSYAVHGARQNGDERLVLSEPTDAFRSDGGSVEVWSSNFLVLQEAGVAAERMTLQPRGLALLQYSTVGKLAYVLQGKAKIGKVSLTDGSTHVRTVRQGDLIAIPKGIGRWWYNHGDESFVVLSLANTAKHGEPESFYLAGGFGSERGSSVLLGFDEELLSDAMDVDRDVVRKIRESQKGIIIVKAKEDIKVDSEQGAEYTYNIDKARPDFQSENGGTFKILMGLNFPILAEIGFSTIRLKLKQGAMFAPFYLLNAHGLVYVTGGTGVIQIVGSQHRLVDAAVSKGSFIVVPQFHPGVLKAGNDGLEFLLILTTPLPDIGYLAGHNAVYRSVPIEIVAACDNVPLEVEQEIFNSRKTTSIILPPRQNSTQFWTERLIKRVI